MDIFYPVAVIAEWIVGLTGLDTSSHMAEVVNFFVYDSIKVFLLLAVIIFIVSFIRTFLPPQRIRKLLSSHGKITGHVIAALVGIVTPFCSCSAIPLFLGIIEAGAPLGVAFTFLVSSPMINEVALVMLFGLFGWKLALAYVVCGLVIAIVSGLFIGGMDVEGLLEDVAMKKKIVTWSGWQERVQYAKAYSWHIIKKVGLYALGAILLGAFIHAYVPTDFLATYASADKWYAVPLATLIGIPLYGNAAAVTPLISALMDKGVAVGTALALMMAITGLSLPEFIILRKVMKPRLIVLFAATVGAGIIVVGYVLNLLQALLLS